MGYSVSEHGIREERSKWREDIKLIIEFLMQHSHTQKELMGKMKGKLTGSVSDEALRKRVERRLQDLEEWGLATKEADGRWHWYTHVRRFRSRAEYEVWLNHSKQLIPALEYYLCASSSRESSLAPHKNSEIAKRMDPNIVEVETCIDKHFEEYPKINSMLKRLLKDEKNFKETERRFRRNILKRLEEKFEGLVDRASGPKKQIYVGDNTPDVIHRAMQERIKGYPPITLKLEEDESISFSNLIVGKGAEVFEKLNDFIEDACKLSEVRELVKREDYFIFSKLSFQDEVRRLKLKVESGEPLKGRCDLCPNVQIDE